MNLNFLSFDFLNNKSTDYLLSATIFLSGIIAIRMLKGVAFTNLRRWAAKTENVYDDAIIRIIEQNFVPIAYTIILYMAVNNLNLHPIIDRVLEITAILIGTFFGIKFFTASVEYIIKFYWITYHQDNANVEQSINALIPAIRVIVWLIGIVFLLDNLGFDISAVVASLGIGGVAIALASQGVLQDLFSYFSILIDRPFELGDFIVVGDYLGTVEYVGIKTTRLKSISGEQIIIANTDLTRSRIRNLKRMSRRRIVFKFGVVYETTTEQLAKIPVLVTDIISNVQFASCDRAHFCGYGKYSLDFEVVYFIEDSDYALYMDAQQQINLKIKSEFNLHGIKFAYPTQVNYFNDLPSLLDLSQELKVDSQKTESIL